MPIKNYTTKVDVYQSLGEIQGALAKNGTRKIMIDYDENGNPVGVTFGINTPQGSLGFLLPANIEGVLKVFAKQKIKIGAKLEAGNEEFISHNLDYRPVCGIKILRG